MAPVVNGCGNLQTHPSFKPTAKSCLQIVNTPLMKTSSETISIRLDQEQLRKLDQRRKPFGDSRGEHIKRLALTSLLELEESQTTDTLRQLRVAIQGLDDEHDRQMEQLNEKLRQLTYVLLSTAGQQPPEEAKLAARRIFPAFDLEQ